MTTYNPDTIEDDIIKYLTENEITPKVDSKKYKIKFDFESMNDNLKNYT